MRVEDDVDHADVVGVRFVRRCDVDKAAIEDQHHGFFTPLFHIASVFVAPTDLMMSVQHAATGDTFYFAAGPALVGP